MIDLRPLLTSNFWLNLSPLPPSDIASKITFVVFAVIVIVGIVIGFMRHRTKDKPKRALLARVSNMVVTMGILGLILFFFLYEQINFFGAHFWFLLWAIGLIAWIVATVRFAKTKTAKAQEDQTRQQERDKYLPKGSV